MARAASKGRIIVTLTNPQPKTRVVRYDCTDENPALSSVYVDKEALSSLASGFPDKIKVTIEAA